MRFIKQLIKTTKNAIIYQMHAFNYLNRQHINANKYRFQI